MKTIIESLQTPVTKRYDVVVVGGGPAGFCAAVASARGGAKTLVVERVGYLGGMLTGGMVGSSGIHVPAPSTPAHYEEIRRRLKTNPDSVHLFKGIPREFLRRLIKEGGGIGYFGEVPSYVCVHVPSVKRLLLKMLGESGVDVLFYAQGVKPIVEGDEVGGVIIQGKGCREAVEAQVVIDATGDGDIAAAAGARFEFGRPEDSQAILMTLMFTIGGIDMVRYIQAELKKDAAWPPRSLDEHLSDMRTGNSCWFGSSDGLADRNNVPEKLRKAIDDFMWSTNKTRGHLFACNSPIPDELFINVTQVFKKSGTNSWDITEAIKICYREIELLEELYKLTLPGFEKSYVREIAPLLGVRETRRITGDYVVAEEDVLSCRKFEDGICGSGHPIDTGEDNKGRFDRLTGGDWFEIPYRSILVKDLEHILTAGRCISADHGAIGAIRPTACCMGLGEAAGCAASLAVRHKVSPRSLDGKEIRALTGFGEGVEIIRVGDEPV